MQFFRELKARLTVILNTAVTSDNKRRLLKGGLWTLLGSFSAQGANMIVAIVCARILGKHDFGVLGMVRSTILMLGVFAGTGLGMAASKCTATYRRGDTARLGRIIGLLSVVAMSLGGVVMAAALAFSPSIAVSLFGDETSRAKVALFIGCFLLLVNTINGMQLGVLSGFEEFRKVTNLTLLDSALYFIFSIAGAVAFDLPGIIGGALLAALASYPFKRRAMHEACRTRNITIVRRGLTLEMGVLLLLIVPAVINGVSIYPFEWLVRYFLSLNPEGFAQVGLFLAAYSWGQIVMFVPAQLTRPTMPILADVYVSIGNAEFEKLVRYALTITMGIAVAVALPLLLLSSFVMSLYGPSFREGSNVLVITLVAHVIASGTVIGSALVAAGRVWWQVFLNAAWGIVLGAVAFSLAHLGAMGAALAYLTAYLVLFILQLMALRSVSAAQ